MADLNDLQAAQTIKIAGANTSGGESAFVESTNNGGLHTNLRNSSGSELIGQTTMVGSIPVVIASDQTITVTSSPLPATGSNFSFGQITTASAASSVPVYKTTYNEQLANGQRSIASSSASDTSAGVGARTVKITYLDQTGAGPFTETLILNGTTGVNTVATNICFIENMEVLTIGSTGSNVGIITLYTAINKGGTTIGTIATGDNQTLWAHHYVSVGKTCFISGFSVNNTSTAVGNGAAFVLMHSTPTTPNAATHQVSDTHRLFGQSSTVTRNYNSPIQVAGPSKITAFVQPESNTSVIQRASFDFIDN